MIILCMQSRWVKKLMNIKVKFILPGKYIYIHEISNKNSKLKLILDNKRCEILFDRYSFFFSFFKNMFLIIYMPIIWLRKRVFFARRKIFQYYSDISISVVSSREYDRTNVAFPFAFLRFQNSVITS